MGFINDNGVVLVQRRIFMGFGQKNAVGHHFDAGCCADGILETDFVPDGLSQRFIQFLGDTAAHRCGRDTARLGNADPSVNSPAGGHAELGQLGGFPGTGFSRRQ